MKYKTIKPWLRGQLAGICLLFAFATCQCGFADETTETDASANAYSLGCQYLDSNEFPRALEAFRRAVAADPDNARYLTGLGIALHRTGHLNQAIEAYQSAIAADPTYGSAFNNSAIVYYTLHRYEEAIDACSRALQLTDSSDVLALRAWACYCSSKYEAALTDAETVLTKTPERPDALAVKGLALAEMQQVDEARQTVNILIRLGKAHQYTAHLVLGNLLLAEGKADAAEVEYSAAIKWTSSEPHAYANRALCKCGRRQFAEALLDFDAALRRRSATLPPITGEILMGKANCLYHLGKFSAAKECVDIVLQHEPENAGALLYRAFIQYRRGDFVNMKDDLQLLVQMNELGDAPAYYLACLLLHCEDQSLRDTARATELASQLYEQGQPENRHCYRALLIECYEATGSIERAASLKESPSIGTEETTPRFRVQFCPNIAFTLSPHGTDFTVSIASETSQATRESAETFKRR